MPRKVIGILLKKEKKFYYFADSGYSGASSADRLKRSLIAKGIIDLIQPTPGTPLSYKIISYEEAEAAGFEMIPVWINKKIRDSNAVKKEPKKNPWGDL